MRVCTQPQDKASASSEGVFFTIYTIFLIHYIREVIFSGSAVSDRVGDVASRHFATAALEGSGFRADTLEGHLKMVFHVSTTWSDFPPERLMGIFDLGVPQKIGSNCLKHIYNSNFNNKLQNFYFRPKGLLSELPNNIITTVIR